MDPYDDDGSAQIHQNQPYDESLEVPDAEEIASTYSPTPRVPNPSGEMRMMRIVIAMIEIIIVLKGGSGG
ncbi:hypothetical protein ACOMHN_013292 [Nucella lapillus]